MKAGFIPSFLFYLGILMEERVGVVIKVMGLYYTVLYNNEEINCNLRGKIRKQSDTSRISNPVAVGDRVLFEMNRDGSGVINEILPRRNIFSRKERGKNRKEDIIAANLDLIIVIQSFKKPRLNLRFVDRILVRGEMEGIDVVLCANKLDLADNYQKEYIRDYYRDSDVGIYMTSALTGAGLKSFKKEILKKVSLLIGYSGVGKTTILNRLFPELNLRVSHVSNKTGKGRHVTTNVQMIVMDDDMALIDTPGLREFGLMDIEPHMLGNYFPEFQKYSDDCDFPSCTHDHEPNCAVKKNVELGNIFEDRYISYLNILYSLKEYYENMY